MNASTRTTTSRKAMRVATVFTGAAAAAVGFAPGAVAAPGHAAAQGHAALANGTARALAPDTTSRGCTTNSWLHIQYSSYFRALCRQFGGVGYAYPLTTGGGFQLEMTAQCGGNNIGRIYPESAPAKPITYRQGTTYRTFPHVVDISFLSISGYGGHDKCAWPR
jgi:hypothetical protein